MNLKKSVKRMIKLLGSEDLNNIIVFYCRVVRKLYIVCERIVYCGNTKVIKMRTITQYQVVNSRIGNMNDENKLRDFAAKMGIINPEIISVSVDVLEDGDNVTVSKHVGGVQDDDGITTGGKWIEITGTYHAMSEAVGELQSNGKFISMMRPEISENIYPVRNVRVV